MENDQHDGEDEVSATDAEITVKDFLPEPTMRRRLLRQLLDSADYARTVAPDAWSVTLFLDAFRLNVGQVEVLVVDADDIRMNCVGHLGVAPFEGPCYEQATYKSVRTPAVALCAHHSDFEKLAHDLQVAHRAFIDVVGRRQSGEPRSGSPHTKSHTQGLIDYAREYVSRPQ